MVTAFKSWVRFVCTISLMLGVVAFLSHCVAPYDPTTNTSTIQTNK